MSGGHLRGEERRLRRLLGQTNAWPDRLELPAINRIRKMPGSAWLDLNGAPLLSVALLPGFHVRPVWVLRAVSGLRCA